MASEINNLIAAQLSQAAYGTYGLPSGWTTIGLGAEVAKI
jgi:hypothetical protein